MTLPASIASPLTGRVATLERSIPSARIARLYLERFGYDASHCFNDVPNVGIYLCETGYRFYYPFSLVGDESLYRTLEKFEWNYKEDKWEHEAALQYMRPNDLVLDVGCGEGNFLAKAMKMGAQVSGIELNRSAASVAQGKGIHVHDELIGLHSQVDHYDVVTSFQVLEHVPDPANFLIGCLRALRPGGTLIIGVPNNDSFLRLDSDAVLNQPPHHMGLWNRRSLSALCDYFAMDARAFEIEPLAETGWYQSVIEKTYLTPWQRRLFYRLGFAKAFTRYVEENANTIAGHSIMAIYEKR